MNIREAFTYHPPHGDQLDRYARIRTAGELFARAIEECAPESAERTLALRAAHLATMHANSAVAINEPAPTTTEET